MFWGMILETGKKYTQTLQQSFTVTMATLGFNNTSDGRVYVVVHVNSTQYVLCSLQSEKLPQQALNLNFTEGEKVSFFLHGDGEVHLTGFLPMDETDSDISSDEDEEVEKFEMEQNVLLQNDLEGDEEIISVLGMKNMDNSESICRDDTCVKNSDNVSEMKLQGILSGLEETSGSTYDKEEGENRSMISQVNIKEICGEAPISSHQIAIVGDIEMNIDNPIFINENNTLSYEGTQLSDESYQNQNTRYEKTQNEKYGTKRTRSKSGAEIKRSWNDDENSNKSDSDIKKKEKCDDNNEVNIRTKNSTREKIKETDELNSKEDNSTLVFPTRTLRKRKYNEEETIEK